jgi:putative resolvase
MELVELGEVRRIIIAHRDRLVRLGYGYFEAFCERHNTQVIVVNGDTMSPEQELVQDLVAIITENKHVLQVVKEKLCKSM